MEARLTSTCVRSASLRLAAPIAVLFVALSASVSYGQNLLVPGPVTIDGPTLTTIGIKLKIASGDADRDAKVHVQYREGAGPWFQARDLFRVDTANVANITPEEQFSGSIFNLKPGTAYEIQLTGDDPDGAVASIPSQMVTTRSVPDGPPASPPPSSVAEPDDEAAFRAALTNPSIKLIKLKAKTYHTGTTAFRLDRSGTSTADPIFIVGTVEDGKNVSIIDGDCNFNCANSSIPNCRALDIRGRFVRIMNVHVTNANQAIFFPSPTGSPTENVVRGVSADEVCIGVTAGLGHSNFYVCDNDFTGKVPVWPHNFSTDGGTYANNVGIALSGTGNVICHNRLNRFGDGISLRTNNPASTNRGDDVYGNDVLSGYDNGIELDDSERNVSVYRNRFLNTLATLSFQPVYGGPVYAFRNVSINTAREQMKFANRGNQNPKGPSGMLVFHNTYLSAPLVNSGLSEVATALHLNNPGVQSFNFRVENNIFLGRTDKPSLPVVSWANKLSVTAPTPNPVFDYNGYRPDGVFKFGDPFVTFANMAALHGSTNPPLEHNGRILGDPVFESNTDAPFSYTALIARDDDTHVELATGSGARDVATPMPNVNDDFLGSAPDIGAIEGDCTSTPLYGPRPAGIDERNAPIGCEGLRAGGSPLCGSAPLTTCRKPTASSRIDIQRQAGGKNKLRWMWTRGALAPADVGDPFTSDSFFLCVYDTPGARRLVYEGLAGAARTDCRKHFLSRACWDSTPPIKTRYKDQNYAPHGLYTIDLRADPTPAGTGGAIKLQGKGANLRLPASMDLQGTVTVQLRSTRAGSPCWDADFTDPDLHTVTKYKASAEGTP